MKSQGNANYKIWWKSKSVSGQTNPWLKSKSPIIDKISLSYDLVECYVFPFLQNEAIEIVVKDLLIHYVRSWKNF
jgi:hypothetical protein